MIIGIFVFGARGLVSPQLWVRFQDESVEDVFNRFIQMASCIMCQDVPDPFMTGFKGFLEKRYCKQRAQITFLNSRKFRVKFSHCITVLTVNL